uniref:Si:dkey-1d7.3 n=1 Tax=Amphiprion percula TaxID=161767 RepID=A0A3P8S6R1_AMPPE
MTVFAERFLLLFIHWFGEYDLCWSTLKEHVNGERYASGTRDGSSCICKRTFFLDSPEPSGNGSLKAQSFLITGLGAGLLQPAVNASYGPLAVDASISPDLLLSGRRILPVILGRQVRSSSPAVKILFHMPSESNITAGQDTEGSRGDNRKNVGAKAKDGAHCVTAYAFWETREVRGACLVPPGGFCVAQLKPEPNWFSSASRSGSSSREAERTEGLKGLQGNVVEVYFQSRRDPTGQCTPQDSLQRVGVGRRRESGGSGTPMRRIGSVSLHKTPPGNPTFLRLRLGGAVVIQTSSKPLKTTDVATFYVFLASTSTLESFTLRGLLEVLQLDFVPKEVSEQAESHTISWRLELPGNVKDVGIMRIHTTQKDYVGLAPLVMNTDVLNTAVLTGKMVLVPVKTLAVEANGSVTDVTNYTSCRSTEEDVLKVSERCNYVYVNGKETRGKSKVMLNFTYGFLSAQLEMSVWMPRLPLFVDVDDPELSQIKGWRVPVTTGNRRSTWDSEEEEEMRKGRGCMLQYQHSTLRVLTPFIVQPDAEVDVTNLVRYNLNVADPDVAWVQDGVVVRGRAVGTTSVQVLSPLTSAVLAERSIRVVDDKVSVTEVGVQLVSGLSLSLRLSPESNRAIVATATTRERIMQLKQEAVVSCWVQFSDGAVTPLDMFDRSVYSLTVSTPDERVATVRRTPQSTFVVAQGEGEGKGALVRVELRICEECQKSKRKSKLAVATTVGVFSRGEGQKRSYGNMLDIPNSPLNKDIPKAEVTPKKQPPKSKTPKVIESDLIKTFRAMSDLEIGMYTLVGVSCVAILAFFINCASYNLCFRKQKTPIQTGPIPSADPKDHKHDWVWLGGSNRGAPSTLPTVSAPAIPERTATLGRSRTSSQQQHFQAKAIDPMANRSATLLARPHRSDPLHSPTSKRNQVQFTTFTTLDIKHLAALKKNGVDLNWSVGYILHTFLLKIKKNHVFFMFVMIISLQIP